MNPRLGMFLVSILALLVGLAVFSFAILTMRGGDGQVLATLGLIIGFAGYVGLDVWRRGDD